MVEYAVEDSGASAVRDALRQALPRSEYTPATLLADLHRWLRANVQFVEDDDTAAGAGFGSGNEVLVRPVDLLAMKRRGEDCDGFSMLAAAMILAARRLFSLPFRVFFTTVAANPERPREFSHVYVSVSIDGRMIPFDASHGPYLGWQIDDRFHKRAYWPVEGFMLARVVRGRGLYGLGQDESVTVLDPSVIADQPPIVETTYPGLPSAGSVLPTGAPVASSSPAWLNSLVQGGVSIIKQVTLPSGEYVQTGPGGQSVMSRNVPGAVPSSVGLSLSSGGASSLLMLGGVAVAIVLVASLAKGR